MLTVYTTPFCLVFFSSWKNDEQQSRGMGIENELFCRVSLQMGCWYDGCGNKGKINSNQVERKKEERWNKGVKKYNIVYLMNCNK